MAINSDKFLPPSKSAVTGGALVAQKPLSGNLKLSTKKINLSKLLPGSGDNDQEGILASIAKQVFQIRDLVLKSSIFKKKQISKDRIESENENFAKKEKKLEEKPSKEEKSLKVPSLPKLGFLDYLKNFIFKTLIGYFVYNLIPHLPKLINFVKNLTPVFDFLVDMSGKLFNGLVSFIDGSYKAIDATRGFIKSVGGEFSLQIFDNFTGAIEGIITATIAAALALSAMSGGDSGGGGSGGGRQRVGGKGAGRVDPKVARRYAERFGKDAALKKFGKEGVGKLGGKYARSGATNLARKGLVGLAGKGGAKMVLGFVRPLLKRLPIIGALIDFGLSVALGEDLGRAAFKAIGAGLLGFIGGVLGGPFAPLTALAGGFLGDMAGGALYDAFFGGKKPQQKNQKVEKKAGGGITRGKKPTGGKIGRTVKQQKRTVRTSRSKVNPGKSIGGEKKLKNIFPEVKDKSNKINPYGYMKSSYEKLSSASAFGGLFALPLKAQLGEQPSKTDYQNAASGLNSWMQRTFSSEIMRTGGVGFAEGGKVEASMFSNSEDMTKVIEKSLEESISSKVTAAINDLKKQLGLKPDEKKTDDKKTGPDGGGDGELETAGGAVAASELYKEIGANLEQWDIYRNSVALIESGGKYSIAGGSGDHYDGRYQMGADAKTDGSKVAGVSNPGHSSDPNAHVRVSYRNNPQLQETVFTGFTIANHRYLMRNPKYKSASVERKLEILGYAHNQGMGGAERWMTTGVVGADGFGTKGTKYTDLIAKNFRAKKSGGAMELAQGAITAPTTKDAQSLSRGAITSYFGSKESFRKKGHEGVDIGLNQGTALSFKMKGTVIDAFRTSSTDREAGGGYGSYMDVKFENGNILRLAHLSKIYPQTKFEPGNVVALSGGTPGYPGSGRSGGAHLHLEQHSAKIGTQETLKGKLDPVKYGGFELVQTGGTIKKFSKGGRVSKPTRALIGERGAEFIFDADTTRGLDRLAPLLLEKLNAARTKPQLASILQSYAPYERSNQEIVVQLPPPEIVEVFVPMPMSGSASYGGGSGSDPYDSLAER